MPLNLQISSGRQFIKSITVEIPTVFNLLYIDVETELQMFSVINDIFDQGGLLRRTFSEKR